MPNDFANTKNQGYLKQVYSDSKSYNQQEPKPKSPLQEALKKKRKKLANTIIGLESDDEL